MNNTILNLNNPKEIIKQNFSPNNWRQILYSFIESRVGAIKPNDLPYISEILQKMQKSYQITMIAELEAQKRTIEKLKQKVENMNKLLNKSL